LVQQSQKNIELSHRLEETMRSKEEMSMNLKEIAGRSKVHEDDLSKLQVEVNALTKSEVESKAECERLR
jgi:hypothetical protein